MFLVKPMLLVDLEVKVEEGLGVAYYGYCCWGCYFGY